MTIEAAITKLSYLIGKGWKIERVKEEFQRNMRGEMTPRQLERQFNMESEPFLLALSSAITSVKSEHDIELNRDLVMPNILCLMTRKNRPFQLNELPKLDINYSAVDYDDRSVLHVAAREGSFEIAEHMLKNSGNLIVNKLDRWQHSPLFEAVKAKNKEMINLLVRYNGKLIAPLNELTNMLMNSIVSKDLLMLDLFYLAGVRDFGQFRTLDNRTIGHLAASLNSNQVVTFLSRNGIQFDWSMKDRWGRTPMDEAKLQKRGVQSLFLKALNTQ